MATPKTVSEERKGIGKESANTRKGENAKRSGFDQDLAGGGWLPKGLLHSALPRNRLFPFRVIRHFALSRSLRAGVEEGLLMVEGRVKWSKGASAPRSGPGRWKKDRALISSG